jgi:predicted ABC-type ATPase
MPTLHVIAGPKGAGKSMFYQYVLRQHLPMLPFIDPQSHVILHPGPAEDAAAAAAAAQSWAEGQRLQLLQAGRSFVTEAVMKDASDLALLVQARAHGYETTLYGLCVDEPRLLINRISQRQRKSAATASQEVLDSHTRCIDNLRRAIRIADMVFLLDAIEARDGGPRFTASIAKGRLKLNTMLLPRWVGKVLERPED